MAKPTKPTRKSKSTKRPVDKPKRPFDDYFNDKEDEAIRAVIREVFREELTSALRWRGPIQTWFEEFAKLKGYVKFG